MEEILFPGLNLKFKINKIAFNIFGIDIYWYAIFIVLGFIISILLLKKDEKKYNVKIDDIIELLIFMIPISLICARIYFIIFKLNYYINNPIQIFNFRNGGLAIYGGIIGAVIATYVYCRVKKIDILDMLDCIVIYLPLGQAIGRVGNFFNIEAYGYETDIFCRMGITTNGQYMEVHPTFLYELICCTIIFCILYNLYNKRKFKGQMVCIYGVLYGFTRSIIEGLRVDSLMLGGFRVSQIISLIILLIFSILLFIRFMVYSRHRK